MLDIPSGYGGGTKNVISMDKGDHRYIFVFSDSDLDKLAPELGRLAADKDLNFRWRDARDIWEFAEEMVDRLGGGRF